MINKLLNQFSNIIRIDDLPSPNEYFGDYIINFQKIKNLEHNWQFIKNCNSLLSDNVYTPNVKDKLFFHKKCNVPRYKVREWGKAKNISITTKQEKANANFINLKAHIQSHDSSWSSWLIASELKTFIEINYKNIDGELKDLVTLLNDNPTLKVCLPSFFNYNGSWLTGSSPYNGARDPKGVKSSLIDLGYKLNTNHITYISTEDYKKYEEIACNA